MRKGGYKIDMSGPDITNEVRSCILKCTESYISTAEKKSIRYRFLSIGKLNQELRLKLSAKISEANNSFKIWTNTSLALKKSVYQVIADKLLSSVSETEALRYV